MARDSLLADRLGLSDDIEKVFDWFYENELTDGLPIIPPTEERVERMVRASGHDPDEVLSILPPRQGAATIEAVAANAVMAGCKPEYMPVLVAAAKALGDEALNLRGIQCTTGGYALLVLINGPIRNTLEVNCAGNAWGQGFRANATIGRAVRLMVTTVAGIYPQKADKGTQGNPGKYSLCLGEYEEVSPWEPFHVERGFDAGDSTVTVVGAMSDGWWQHNKNNDALSILSNLAYSIPVRGPTRQLLICICPERARDIGQGGFSKQDIKQFLYEHARKPVWFHKMMGNWTPEWNRFYPRLVNLEDDHAMIPTTLSPNEYMIIVAGGAGAISPFYELSGSPVGDRTLTEGVHGFPVTVKIET